MPAAQPLVTPRPVLRVGLDKSALRSTAPGQARASATRLARLVGIDASAFARQAVQAGAKAFVPAIVYRRADAPAAVTGALSSIPGARAISDRLPLAPTKDFAAALLGTVGPATKEVVDASRGRVRAGDDVGLSGLQKRYDARLAGTRGETVVVVDDRGERRTLFTADPVAGEPLRTTLDLGAQRLAQQVLSGVGPASALVAVRPSTGAIVAAASGPGSKGYNTATFGQYAPGSTFKVVSALALLRAGLTPSSRVPCTPTTVVDGKSFKNYSDYPSSGLGRITLEDALANSCNTAFISQRDRLDGPAAGPGGGRARAGRRPRHRLPGVLRAGGHAGQRDPAGGRDDRPGHRARLAPGDGHRGRLGDGGVGRAAPPAARRPGRAGGARPSRSPPPRRGPCAR